MRPILERPVSYLITNGDADPDTYIRKKNEILESVRRAVSAEVSVVQIREKKLTAKQVFEVTAAAVTLSCGSRTRIVVNERIDVALAAAAHGVHLPSSAVPIRDVRSVTPQGFIIGVSTHCEDEVLKAREDGADFAVFGPVFSSPGKPDGVGIGELSRVCQSAFPFPVLALGGIDDANVASALDAGAAGFAAIRFMHSRAGLTFAKELRNDGE